MLKLLTRLHSKTATESVECMARRCFEGHECKPDVPCSIIVSCDNPAVWVGNFYGECGCTDTATVCDECRYHTSHRTWLCMTHQVSVRVSYKRIRVRL